MRTPRSAWAACAAGLLLLAFATPVRVLWMTSSLGWWAPFALWGIAIAVLAVASRQSDDGGPV